MKEIIITGGGGFIGSHIQDRLLSEGHAVTVIDNFSSGDKKNIRRESTLYEIDIRDGERLGKVVRDVHPDIIFHLAAQSKVAFSMDNPKVDQDINVGGTLNLLDSVKGSNRIERIIYSNTGGALYGDVDDANLPIDEMKQEPHPSSFYGLSKLYAENYLNLYGKVFGLQWVSLRYANVYGPRQTPQGEAGIVPAFIDKLISGMAPIIHGDGLHTRDYVFVEDVVNANILAMSHQASDFFNISSGIETSNKEVFDMITCALGVSIDPIYDPERPGDVRRNSLKNLKAKDKLGWQPKVELKEGIETTISSF